jgi:hypothetical protein
MPNHNAVVAFDQAGVLEQVERILRLPWILLKPLPSAAATMDNDVDPGAPQSSSTFHWIDEDEKLQVCTTMFAIEFMALIVFFFTLFMLLQQVFNLAGGHTTVERMRSIAAEMPGGGSIKLTDAEHRKKADADASGFFAAVFGARQLSLDFARRIFGTNDMLLWPLPSFRPPMDPLPSAPEGTANPPLFEARSGSLLRLLGFRPTPAS